MHLLFRLIVIVVKFRYSDLDIQRVYSLLRKLLKTSTVTDYRLGFVPRQRQRIFL
jgi:hypothetical protein